MLVCDTARTHRDLDAFSEVSFLALDLNNPVQLGYLEVGHKVQLALMEARQVPLPEYTSRHPKPLRLSQTYEKHQRPVL